tara:strand:- start:5332 stop:5784 length:453 start_codon:yes stop_codon:yes gene_type:complete
MFNDLKQDIQTQISITISKENEDEDINKTLQYLKEENNHVFYITKGDNIVGSLQIDSKLISDNIAKLLYFIIDKNERRKGYGKKLLSQTLNTFIEGKRINSLHLYLMVRTEKLNLNEAAINLYQMFGFKMTKLKVLYSDGENTVMLKYNK